MSDGETLSYSEAQKTRIETFARLARGMLTHPGEKGRVLEGIVSAALREFLPTRFSIGTGFAANSKKELSKQLDVVIYDHVYNAPIMFDNDVGNRDYNKQYRFPTWTAPEPDQIETFLKARGRLSTMAAEWIGDYRHFVEKNEIRRPGEMETRSSL